MNGCSHVIFPATALSISWLVRPSPCSSCCCRCSMLRRSCLLCCSLNSLPPRTCSPAKEPGRTISRPGCSGVSHSSSVVRSSRPCCYSGGEGCWCRESSVFIPWSSPRSLSWSSLSSLKIANQPPASLVEK